MKKITDFSQSFANHLENDVLYATESLLNAFQVIAQEYNEISDETIKLYQKEHPGDYTFSISISCLRNYLKRYGYVIRKDSPFILKEFTLDQLKILYEKAGYTSSSESQITATSDYKKENLNVGQKIALEYAEKSETYKNFEALNMRCASSIKKSFLELCANHPCFGKSFLFTFVIEKGIEKINE